MDIPVPDTRFAAWVLAARRLTASTALRRGISLTAVIAVLQVVVFSDFYSGRMIPPYDFLGAYAGEAFVWWTDGGFFGGSEWVPYAWGGYPSAAGLQNSGWYLPTGFITLFGPYTLHMAAILAALHVAFGAYGMYFLLRAFRAGFGISLFASVALFFGVGFYSNASHIDIARAYAWLPWILLVFTPLWKWERWWSIPLGSLILWQALTGVYPGTSVAAVYALLPWTAVLWSVYRPKFTRFILPLAFSGLIALLLSMPRLLPYLFLDDISEATGPADTSVFSFSLLGTILFGYGTGLELPNDVTMRSFFVPVTVLVLAVFARWSDPLCKAALALGVPSLLLGIPRFPWFEAAQDLPGLGLSRFTMSDYKTLLVIAAILLASSGLRNLLSLQARPRPGPANAVSLALAWLLILVFGVLAVHGPQSKLETIPPLILLAVTLAVVTAYLSYHWAPGKRLLTSRVQAQAVLFASVLILLTAVSGVTWAFTTPGPWRVDRLSAEKVTYDDTVDNLLQSRAANISATTQRPGREPLPPGFTTYELHDVAGNAAFFSGDYSIAAYVNLKRSASHEALEQTLLNSDLRDEFAAYLALPGTLIAAAPDGAVSQAALADCVRGGCGVEASPLSYSSGHYVYRVSLDKPTTVNLNEAFFPGWVAQACTADADCAPLSPEPSAYGTIQIALPAGEFDLKLDYSTPGLVPGWGLFAGGLLILLGAGTTMALTGRRKEVAANAS